MRAILDTWMRWRFLLLAVACASGHVVAAEQLEYAVKAAYLAKFASYVDWPPAAFAKPTSPVVLCVVGEDPFGPLLDEAAAGQQVSGRAIVVRRLKSIGRDAGCHIAYLGKDAHADDLRGSGTLVVADSGSGIINFVVKDNRVRFTVDDDAAAKNGLAISSKLLNVALSVKSRSPQ